MTDSHDRDMQPHTAPAAISTTTAIPTVGPGSRIEKSAPEGAFFCGAQRSRDVFPRPAIRAGLMAHARHTGSGSHPAVGCPARCGRAPPSVTVVVARCRIGRADADRGTAGTRPAALVVGFVDDQGSPFQQ